MWNFDYSFILFLVLITYNFLVIDIVQNITVKILISSMEFMLNNIAMISIPCWNACLNLNVKYLLSFALMPGLGLLVALHQLIALLVVPLCAFIILYNHRKTQSNRKQTRFFAVWLWSAVIFTTLMYHWDVFYVQMLRMTVQRTVTVLLAIAALYCGGNTIYILKWREKLNPSKSTNCGGSNEDKNLMIDVQYLIEEDQKICIHCNCEQPRSSVHCSMCGTCVNGFIHHSYWLDCCISKENCRYYYATLLMSLFSLLAYIYFTLTMVCNSFYLGRFLDEPFFLPENCSIAFNKYLSGVSFVLAIQACIISVYIFIKLFKNFNVICPFRKIIQ